MKTISILLIGLFLFSSCLDEKIEITSEYIINEKWDKKGEEIGANSIEIKRLKQRKDSTINPFSELSQVDILNKLEADSGFIYFANVKIKPRESYKNKKIYFNKDNGFYWVTDQGNRRTKLLGKLEENTWYEISRLNYYYYVIFIDSTARVHRFVINATNW